MKKTVIIYSLMIILIAFLIFAMNIPFDFYSSITFPHSLHIGIETLITVVMFLIFTISNNLYEKTKNERYAILAGGFLLSSILNVIHIFTAKHFPYDNLSIESIRMNQSLIYLLLSNMIIPLSIYISLLYKPSAVETNNFRFKVYSTYFYIMLMFAAASFVAHNFFANYSNNFIIVVHSLECINYVLYILIASILINMNYREEQHCSFTLISGLIIFGLSGLFFMNPLPIPNRGVLAHMFQLVGFILILKGVPCIQFFASRFKFKDELVAYLSLLLIAFYICFVSIISGIFHLILPSFSAYLFIEFLLFFQLVIYVIANLSWQKVADVYMLAERQQSIVRIFETLSRISNPNIIKDSIINEIKNYFNTDKCFIALYNKETKSFYLDKYYQNLPSKTLDEFEEEDKDSLEIEKFSNIFKNFEFCFSNVNTYISNNDLEKTPQAQLLKEYNIKSYYSLPIYHNVDLLGYLILQYTREYKEISQEDLSYLKRMVNQISKAIISKDEN